MKRAKPKPKSRAKPKPAAAAAEAPRREIEMWPLHRLRESPDNARAHGAAQVQQLGDSFEEYGVLQPLVVDPSGEVIIGHGRLAALRRLGAAAEVPVIVADLTPDQAAMLRIADNSVGERSSWNPKRLLAEVAKLEAARYDTLHLGFTDEQLAALRRVDARTSPGGGASPEGGEDPEDAEPARCAAGDVWQAGRHVLVCGQPADPQVLDAARDGAKPHLLITDLGRAAATGDTAPVWEASGAAVVYAWTQPLQFGAAADEIAAARFDVKAQIVWDRQRLSGRGTRYRPEHEACVYAVRRGAKAHWHGGRRQGTAWTAAAIDASSLAVECFERPLRNSTLRGQAALDPYVGDGASLIAAEMTGRTLHGVEQDPARLASALARWETRTGRAAERRDPAPARKGRARK